MEIGFVLHLDQEAASLEYDEPTNAAWVDSDNEPTNSVLFYPELMIPRGLPPFLSPFVATSGNFRDLREYQAVEAARRRIKANLWPVLERVYVHFENGNIELMGKDAAELTGGKVPNLSDEENRAGWLMAATRHFFDFFVSSPVDEQRIRARRGDSRRKTPSCRSRSRGAAHLLWANGSTLEGD